MATIWKTLAITTALIFMMASSVQAETRAECERGSMKHAPLAIGGAAGTVGGTLVGAKACLGALGWFFVDWGLSYAACVTAVTLIGGAVGAAAGEAAVIAKSNQCAKLPDKDER